MASTPHIDFIAAAYAAAVIVIGILIAWVMLDYRALTRKIAELEMQGYTRRSAAARPAEPVGGTARQAAKEQA